MSKHDFDEYWREEQGDIEEKEITIEGQKWDLAPVLPAEASIIALRMMDERGADGKVHVDEIINVYNAIMGEEQVQKLLKTGIGLKNYSGS